MFAGLFALIEGASAELILRTLILLELVALLSVPSVLLRRRGRPTAAIAWLLSLFAFPAFGSIAWWAIGRTRIDRKLRRHLKTKRDFVERHGPPSQKSNTVFDQFLPARAHGEHAFSSAGNRVKLLADGQIAFPEMERSIASAKKCVHMLFYIFELDATGERICSLLEGRAKAGVKVRLLLDGFGCQKTYRRLMKRLRPSGVEVAVFLPSRLWPLYAPRFNFVNHRKILVVDGYVAFTGGMNIAEIYEHGWRDLMLRLEGPAATGLNHIFLEDWYFATGHDLGDPKEGLPRLGSGSCDAGIVASGPDTEGWIHDAYFMTISQAKSRLFIATPYFIPTQAILTALRTAAGRGVDVRLVVPSLSDVRLVMWASRSFYRLLIKADVRIFEYPSAMLHAKALLQDDDLCSVGSANIDNRSFRLSFEVSCFIADRAISSELSEWLEALFVESEEITLKSIDEASTWRKLVESAAHLLSPLL